MANTIHITDVFFHAEIARALGRKASDQWLFEQLRPSISPTSSGQSCEGGGERAWRESEPCQSSLGTSTSADQTVEYECAMRSDIEIDKELGDLVGLLFTDAAHTVLPQIKFQRSSY